MNAHELTLLAIGAGLAMLATFLWSRLHVTHPAVGATSLAKPFGAPTPPPNTPEEVASDPPSAPEPDDTKTEKTMSLKDDASAFAAKGESILASAEKAIESAVAKAKADLDTFYQNQIADLKADADAGKTIYENTITDLQSKIEAMSAPAADAQ